MKVQYDTGLHNQAKRMLGLLGGWEKGLRRGLPNTWSLCYAHAKCCWPFYSFSVVKKCSRDHSALCAKPTRGENCWVLFPTFFFLFHLGSWYCWSGGIRVIPWHRHGNGLEEKLCTWQTVQWCHQQVWCLKYMKYSQFFNVSFNIPPLSPHSACGLLPPTARTQTSISVPRLSRSRRTLLLPLLATVRVWLHARAHSSPAGNAAYCDPARSPVSVVR